MPDHNIINASDWVSVPEVARRAGVSRQAVHQAIANKRLIARKFGSRSIMVHNRDAERYIETRKAKAS